MKIEMEENLKDKLDQAKQKGYDNGFKNGYDKAFEDLKEIWFADDIADFMQYKYQCVMEITYMLERHRPQDVITCFKEWRKKQNEIKVGDVVRFATDTNKYIVTRITNATIETIDKEGHVDTWKTTASLHKWGNYNVANKLQDLFKGI